MSSDDIKAQADWVEEANALVSTDFAASLKESTKESYCSFRPKDVNGKKILYRAMSNPDKKLNDCINIEICATDLYCETITIHNDETGEDRICPRLVIIDKDGISYQSVSIGVFNSLKRIIQIFGEPTWKDGIHIKPIQVSRGVNKITTLELI